MNRSFPYYSYMSQLLLLRTTGIQGTYEGVQEQEAMVLSMRPNRIIPVIKIKPPLTETEH